MARGQAAPSVFPEHAEYAPLLCDILRGGLTWLFRSGGLSHARRLLPESGRRAALLHAKRVWGGRAVRHAQPAKPAKRRKEDNLGHAKSREPHPRTVSCRGTRAVPLLRTDRRVNSFGEGPAAAAWRNSAMSNQLEPSHACEREVEEVLESDKFVQENEKLKSNLIVQMKYFKTRISSLKVYMLTLDELKNILKVN